MASLQKIISHLWFDKQAEEAVQFYLSVFKNGKIRRKNYYGKEGKEIHGMPEGMVMTIEFEIEGQIFIALNGGPYFKFNEAVSFLISCDTQEEIDYYWEKLSEGADKGAQQCGWLKDKFGLSWQVIPSILPEMLGDANQEKSQRVVKSFLQMKKMDIATLKRQFDK